MKKIITLITFVFILQSCENKTQKVTENKPLQQTVDKDGTHPSEYEDVKIDNHSNDKTILGEDAQEINCYVKNIYEKNGIIYVDVDFIEIKDENVVVNKNPKIRTYIIDSHTEITTKDCKQLNALDMLKNKDILLKDKITVVIGESKNGKMLSINFGCYG